jgi:DNA topoisomerase II
MMSKKSITDFLSNEYREFAMYTIENRAIPSVIDGVKISARKILHTSNSIWRTGNEKTLKVFQLAGKVASDCYYHHSNTSLEGSIVSMAQKFKNNVPFLEEDGQFGSLRSPSAGASRYIGTKLSNNFRHIFKDFELLKFKSEDGEKIEPYYFLPIIPTILVNGSYGIAVGFSCNILSRDINEVINACIKVLKGGKPGDIKPYISAFGGTFTQSEDNPKKWHIRGLFKRINTTTVKITELPPSMTYEKYEEILDKLVHTKSIVSYEDNSKNGIDYIIKFTRSDLSKLDDQSLIKLLKLEENSTEIFSTLDENDKLKIFESPSEIIEYFIKFRLEYYSKRKEFLLSKIRRELEMLSNRAKFIKAIIDKKIKVNNVPKSEIINSIENIGISKIDDSYDYLLKMQIYSLTKEIYEKLIADLGEKRIHLEQVEKKNTVDMYLEDLYDLSRKFK